MTIVFDVVIFLLPIPVLWTLQINRRRKAALSGIFLLGLFTTVCSILRMARIPALAVDGNSTFLVLWGTIEMNVGVRNLTANLQISSSDNDMKIQISLTCVPALGPLFTYILEKTSPHPSSTRRNPFDSSEMQSTEGITTHVTATQRTDPCLSASESDPYSKFSRSQDHDSEMGISNSNRTQIHNHHSLDLEIRETYSLEIGVRRH
jgi:hypothetical protein